jgi:hypothetical protein
MAPANQTPAQVAGVGIEAKDKWMESLRMAVSKKQI